jgi:hypothetical protein
VEQVSPELAVRADLRAEERLVFALNLGGFKRAMRLGSEVRFDALDRFTSRSSCCDRHVRQGVLAIALFGKLF